MDSVTGAKETAMTTPIERPYESCTLPAADLPGRLAEFDAAFAAGLRHAEVISPVHARLVFTADQARAEALAGLLRRESECCSFFAFGQRAEGDLVTVDVTVPPGHAEMLAALAGRAAGHLAGQQPPARR
jgi:hypothetical protein